jgi:hypothetical protein
MTDFPNYRMPVPPILTPFSPEACGGFVSLAFGGTNHLGTIASASFPANNRAYYYPFTLTDWGTALKLLLAIGATSVGNVDVGIYTSEKNNIVSAGSTAMSATVNTIQEIDITDTLLPPGEYLLAVALSDSTGTVLRVGLTDELGLSLVPVYEEDVFPLPATAAPVISASTTVPLVGVGIQFASVA